MYFWIGFAIWNILNYLVAMMFVLTLKPRFKRIPGWLVAFLYMLLVLPVSLCKITYFDHYLISHICYYLGSASLILLIVVPFKDAWWKKVLSFLLITVITYVGEDISITVADRMGYTYTADYSNPDNFFALGIGILCYIIGICVVVILWNICLNRVRMIQKIWIFFLFPVSQLAVISSVRGQTIETDSVNVRIGIAGMLGILVGFVADMVLLYILVEQDKALRIRQHMQELHNKQIIEEAHYKETEEKHTELAKIRHDYNNQLSVVYHLLDEENASDAEMLLQELMIKVGSDNRS